MKLLHCIAILAILQGSALFAESLWTDNFQGYLAKPADLEPGRIVTVRINSQTNLKYSSGSSGSREMTLTFTGGNTENLFSFLPKISSNTNKTQKGDQSLTLTTEIAARVQEVDQTGTAFIQGSRSMNVDGSLQAVTVSGWIDPSKLDENGSIPFNSLADGKLVFRTFLQTEKPVLTEQDLQKLMQERTVPAGETPAADNTAAGGAAGTGTAPQTAGAQPSAGSPSGGYTLTDAKKKELLLRYMNEFINLIFPE